MADLALLLFGPVRALKLAPGKYTILPNVFGGQSITDATGFPVVTGLPNPFDGLDLFVGSDIVAHTQGGPLGVDVYEGADLVGRVVHTPFGGEELIEGVEPVAAVFPAGPTAQIVDSSGDLLGQEAPGAFGTDVDVLAPLDSADGDLVSAAADAGSGLDLLQVIDGTAASVEYAQAMDMLAGFDGIDIFDGIDAVDAAAAAADLDSVLDTVDLVGLLDLTP